MVFKSLEHDLFEDSVFEDFVHIFENMFLCSQRFFNVLQSLLGRLWFLSG